MLKLNKMFTIPFGFLDSEPVVQDTTIEYQFWITQSDPSSSHSVILREVEFVDSNESLIPDLDIVFSDLTPQGIKNNETWHSPQDDDFVLTDGNTTFSSQISLINSDVSEYPFKWFSATVTGRTDLIDKVRLYYQSPLYTPGVEIRDSNGNRRGLHASNSTLDTSPTPYIETVQLIPPPPSVSEPNSNFVFDEDNKINFDRSGGRAVDGVISADGFHFVHCQAINSTYTRLNMHFYEFVNAFDHTNYNFIGTYATTTSAGERVRGVIGATEDPSASEYGKVFYLLPQGGGNIIKVRLETAWDPSIAESVEETTLRYNVPMSIYGSIFINGGDAVVLCINDYDIKEFSLSTAYDLDTINLSSPTQSINLSSQNGGEVNINSLGIQWVSEGNYAYVNGGDGTVVLYDSSSSKYDISTFTSANRLFYNTGFNRHRYGHYYFYADPSDGNQGFIWTFEGELEKWVAIPDSI